MLLKTSETYAVVDSTPGGRQSTIDHLLQKKDYITSLLSFSPLRYDPTLYVRINVMRNLTDSLTTEPAKT